ncbi:PfkB family carbohydrate kinase [Luteipulveratus halotolerans]|uniref:PfkB family carbohydrate kinase n=1 Tax=Luteipulveratus halotolerans TaxID=1631356 RepID=UPI0022B14245|nr:PfkB family carbohydrate kinase [Luteipulveratus halotolerans]
MKPNHDELREVTGHTDPLTGAHELQRRGARAVVVSRGEDGMLLLGADGTVRTARTREPLHGNPTGAGDAAVAALAAGLGEGLDTSRLLRRAVAWSAAAVIRPVAGEIDVALAERLMHDLIEGDA